MNASGGPVQYLVTPFRYLAVYLENNLLYIFSFSDPSNEHSLLRHTSLSRMVILNVDFDGKKIKLNLRNGILLYIFIL